MIINIRGEKIEITEAIRKKIEIKCDKIKKYFNDNQNIIINVKIKIQNKCQTIEVTILTNQFTIRAEETKEDFYTALDLVIDKIERQIRKNKTKIKNKYQSSTNINVDIEDKEEFFESKIVKRKVIESKPMDEDEALIQIELLDHDFFLFKNIQNDCISVLYKRKDENYGIINIK